MLGRGKKEETISSERSTGPALYKQARFRQMESRPHHIIPRRASDVAEIPVYFASVYGRGGCKSTVGHWAEKAAAGDWFSNWLPQMHHHLVCMKSVRPWVWPVLSSNHRFVWDLWYFLGVQAGVFLESRYYMREYGPMTGGDEAGGKVRLMISCWSYCLNQRE